MPETTSVTASISSTGDVKVDFRTRLAKTIILDKEKNDKYNCTKISALSSFRNLNLLWKDGMRRGAPSERHWHWRVSPYRQHRPSAKRPHTALNTKQGATTPDLAPPVLPMSLSTESQCSHLDIERIYSL